CDPLLNLLQLAVCETTLPFELAFAGQRLPRRHHAACGDVANQRRAALEIVVGDQAERTDLARPMAGRAARPHDRRDVLGEGEARLSTHLGCRPHYDAWR